MSMENHMFLQFYKVFNIYKYGCANVEYVGANWSPTGFTSAQSQPIIQPKGLFVYKGATDIEVSFSR